jgi:hypothetical protein
MLHQKLSGGDAVVFRNYDVSIWPKIGSRIRADNIVGGVQSA